MSDRHVIVTGASTGLGNAVVRRLSGEGWNISFGARTRDRISALREELSYQPVRLFDHVLDVSNEGSVSTFFDRAIEVNGTPHAVVHCAGVYGPFGPTQSIDPQVWMKTIEINLLGTLLVAQRSLQLMTEEGFGRIVVLSGGGATNPMPNISAYAASKAAVVRLVETLAREIQDKGVQINAVAPGLMATQMLDEVLAAGSEVIGNDFYLRMKNSKENNEDSLPEALALIAFLVDHSVPGLNGRLISAKWDPWSTWIDQPNVFDDENAYTLRRQLPR